MPSLNLTFHVTSALIFAILVYRLLRQQAALRFHERLWAALPQRSGERELRTFLLDWPERFLARLSQSWGFSLSGTLSASAPQRIEVQPWIRAHQALGLRRIVLGPDASLTVAVARFEADLGSEASWQAALESSLGGSLAVRLHVSGFP